MKPVLYVVANKGLDMSPGKLAAQVAHAVIGATGHITNDWLYHPQRWAIILEAEDEMHLNAIAEYLTDRNVHTHVVIDEGSNEIRPFTYTALGVQVLDKDSPEAAYLSGLKKYVGMSKNVARERDMYKRLYEEYSRMTEFEHWVAATRTYVDGLPKELLSRRGRKQFEIWRKRYSNRPTK